GHRAVTAVDHAVTIRKSAHQLEADAPPLDLVLEVDAHVLLGETLEAGQDVAHALQLLLHQALTQLLANLRNLSYLSLAHCRAPRPHGRTSRPAARRASFRRLSLLRRSRGRKDLPRRARNHWFAVLRPHVRDPALTSA